jgi:hypothetical protein
MRLARIGSQVFIFNYVKGLIIILRVGEKVGGHFAILPKVLGPEK